MQKGLDLSNEEQTRNSSPGTMTQIPNGKNEPIDRWANLSQAATDLIL